MQRQVTAMVGLMQSMVLAGIFMVVFGTGPARSEKGRKRGVFLSGLVSELSRKYSEEKLMQRVDSAVQRSTCE